MSIFEGISVVNGELNFDWGKDSSQDVIPLKIQNYNKRVSTISKFPYYLAYRFPKTVPKESKDRVRELIKYLKTPKTKDVELMVNKAVMQFNNIDSLNSYDTVVLPQSSSVLLKLILSKIKPKLNQHVTITNQAIVKLHASEVTFKMDKFEKLNDIQKKAFVKAVMSKKNLDNFKMTNLHARQRSLIDQFLSLSNDFWISKIVNKKVLFIDDITTTGATVAAASKLLLDKGANKVMSFIFLGQQDI